MILKFLFFFFLATVLYLSKKTDFKKVDVYFGKASLLCLWHFNTVTKLIWQNMKYKSKHICYVQTTDCIQELDLVTPPTLEFQ